MEGYVQRRSGRAKTFAQDGDSLTLILGTARVSPYSPDQGKLACDGSQGTAKSLGDFLAAVAFHFPDRD